MEATMCWTWILKIPEYGFDIQPLMIFQTETEIETWVYSKGVPWATDYDNSHFHAVW